MCDFDPPIDNSYDPEFPLESDDEFDDHAKSSALGLFAVSTEINDAESNLNLDEAESSCSSSVKPASRVYTDLFCVKTYTRKDLYPTEPDPTHFPIWALSFYWPVYVDNFRLNSLDEEDRNAQISTFFATKGLLTRMIYIREDEQDIFYKHNQKKNLLLDMLVYFTSQEDAERAIRCCHRTTYYGHRLNVFSGRIPEYFDLERTVRFQTPKSFPFEWTETRTELALQSQHCLTIETIVKPSCFEFIVEFGDVQTLNLAVEQQQYLIPSRITEPVQKQRYLEDDLKIELMWKIQEDPTFIEMVPPEDVMQHLLNGKLPPVERDWEDNTVPKDLPPSARSEIEKKRQNRKRTLKERRAQKEAGIAPNAGSKNPGKGGVKKRKNEVKQKVQAFLGTAPPTWSRPQRLEWKFNSKRDEFLLARTELLSMDPGATLATRNKLFYKLYNVEKQFSKVAAELGREHECEHLKKGLIAALQAASETKDFPNYPSDVKYSDQQDPLDRLWPIYVGNFPVTDLNPKSRNKEINDFFASKQFNVALIYVGDNDPFYNSYLKHIKLLDMLVYFNSEEVADKVYHTCHRTIYRDSKLNVSSGRRPIPYFINEPHFVELDPNPTVAEAAIQRIILNTPPKELITVARLPGKAVFVFSTKGATKRALEKGLPLQMLTSSIPKQRFLESDVKDDIMRRLAYDAEFVTDQPKPNAVKQLFAVESMPSSESSEVVWGGIYQKQRDINRRIGRVLNEWRRLQWGTGR